MCGKGSICLEMIRLSSNRKHQMWKPPHFMKLESKEYAAYYGGLSLLGVMFRERNLSTGLEDETRMSLSLKIYLRSLAQSTILASVNNMSKPRDSSLRALKKSEFILKYTFSSSPKTHKQDIIIYNIYVRYKSLRIYPHIKYRYILNKHLQITE